VVDNRCGADLALDHAVNKNFFVGEGLNLSSPTRRGSNSVGASHADRGIGRQPYDSVFSCLKKSKN
jgi:hypothetical protein